MNTKNNQSYLSRYLSFLVLLLPFIPITTYAQINKVDFKYAPAHWMSSIGFPDDWQKTLVNQDGALCYNFGPGPYATPLTTVSIGVKNQNLKRTKQYLPDPKVPLVTTKFSANNLTVEEHAFAIVDNRSIDNKHAKKIYPVVRKYGLENVMNWSDVPSDIDPAFRDVAWGTNRPIKYLIRVPKNSRKQIILGFSDSRYGQPGLRMLNIYVEGTSHLIIDPAAKGKNIPQVFSFNAKDVNGDGQIQVLIKAAPNGKDPNTYINALWMFPEGTKINREALIRGKESSKAELFLNCGHEPQLEERNPRRDAILAYFHGNDFSPVITIHSTQHFIFDKTTGVLSFRNKPFLVSRPRAESAVKTGKGWQLMLPNGTQKAEVMVIHGYRMPEDITHIPDLEQAEKKADSYWNKTKTIPFNRIKVPDKGIQYVLDANIRNLYQIREKVDGHLQFQPGPSVYRGLWIHDSAMLNEGALFLGDTAGVRKDLEGLFQFQKANGQIEVMSPHTMYRETPVLIFMMTHYATISGNKEWLAARWNRIERAVQWIKSARDKTLSDPNSLYYGLFPPGFTDGGLAGVTAEYSSVYWSLISIKNAIKAAQWLGEKQDQEQWQSLYDAILNSFQKAARRDMRKDNYGNWYLPVKVGDKDPNIIPQQAQWSVCEAQYYGHVFPVGDSLITGSLRMLDDHSEEGMTTTVGWMNHGIWGWFGAIQGMANVWEKRCTNANNIMYAFANHACPLGTWVEEQMPKNRGTRTSGDVSNASGSALFISFLRRQLLLERGENLELLPCLPDYWIHKNADLELNGLPTTKGIVHFKMNISDDENHAAIHIKPIGKAGMPGHITLHLKALQSAGFKMKDGKSLPESMNLDWGKAYYFEFVK